MKKNVVLLLMLFPLFLYGQVGNEVPVKNGKVVFSETILTPKKAGEIKDTVLKWLEEDFLPGKGAIANVDTINNMIVCRVMETLTMEKKDWHQFVMHMRYTLVVECKTNQCVLTVNNIGYIEPEALQTSKDNIAVYSAESVLIDRQYKEAFIKDPIDKIQKATINNIED
ncbi:MAG: DUF4468 domain-containing protein, partial [Bacteroidales bacterium]|nr:DUF4468 domain-containing protein [Bacteroidales bacterium]